MRPTYQVGAPGNARSLKNSLISAAVDFISVNQAKYNDISRRHLICLPILKWLELFFMFFFRTYPGGPRHSTPIPPGEHQDSLRCHGVSFVNASYFALVGSAFGWGGVTTKPGPRTDTAPFRYLKFLATYAPPRSG